MRGCNGNLDLVKLLEAQIFSDPIFYLQGEPAEIAHQLLIIRTVVKHEGTEPARLPLRSEQERCAGEGREDDPDEENTKPEAETPRAAFATSNRILAPFIPSPLRESVRVRVGQRLPLILTFYPRGEGMIRCQGIAPSSSTPRNVRDLNHVVTFVVVMGPLAFIGDSHKIRARPREQKRGLTPHPRSLSFTFCLFLDGFCGEFC